MLQSVRQLGIGADCQIWLPMRRSVMGMVIAMAGSVSATQETLIQASPKSQRAMSRFWGPPEGYELLVLESQYLAVLTQMLFDAAHEAEANLVRALAVQRQGA